MTQQLTTLTALSEDWGSIPSTTVPGDPTPLHTGKISKHTKINIFKAQ